MTLMHKNIPVAKLKMEDNKPVGFEMIYKIDELPLGVKGNNLEQDRILLKHWYESRTIPNLRPNIIFLEQKLGISIAEAFIKSAGVSLTDTYWLKDENSDISWEEINYHKNGFSQVLGNAELLQQYLFKPSPDFTTDGIMDKFWLSMDGKPYLYKKDTKYNNILSANEVFVSQIAFDLGIKTVPYFAGKHINKFSGQTMNYCFCPCFVENDQIDFINAMQVKHSNFQLTGDKLLRYFIKELGFEKQIKQMITLDCFLHNTDRHERNFGYLQKENGEKTFVPLFDNGFCLGANRNHLYPITDNDMKPTNSSRKELLEKYFIPFDIDTTFLFDTLQKIYEEFSISEIRYQMAKEELNKGIEIIQEFQNKKSYKIFIENDEEKEI